MLSSYLNRDGMDVTTKLGWMIRHCDACERVNTDTLLNYNYLNLLTVITEKSIIQLLEEI